MLLIIGFGVEIHHFDVSLELLGLGVEVVEVSSREVVLIIEKGDFGLIISFELIISMPFFAKPVFESLVLPLAGLRLWSLHSFFEIEGGCQKLLPV